MSSLATSLYSAHQAITWVERKGLVQLSLAEALAGVDALLYVFPSSILGLLVDKDKQFNILRVEKPVVQRFNGSVHLTNSELLNSYAIGDERPICIHAAKQWRNYELYKATSHLYRADPALFPFCSEVVQK